MEIKKVALIGAGAIGSYFINGLSRKPGLDFCVVAEGERRERLMRDGLVIDGENVALNVRTPEEAAGPDLIIITVKYGALDGALELAKRIMGPDTVVMTPLNGIDSEERAAKVLGKECIVHSLMKISIQRTGTNNIHFQGKGKGVVFGETDGTVSERVAALEELFTGTTVRFAVSSDIIRDIWHKFVLNMSTNIPQAIINCNFGAYVASSHMEFLANSLGEEVIRVGTAKGIDFSDYTVNYNYSPNARYSTLQDLDAGRETEIEMLCGTLIKVGKEVGVETPYNEFAYHCIKALEEKNKGLF